jgi:signal transduction histidine kinase
MAWATALSGRALTPAQLTLAEELGNRLALSVDNARLYAGLEARVAERTAALHATNDSLAHEVAERVAAEAALARSRDQLRDLADRLQAVREEERTRVAYRIHDELGQQLAGLKMDIAWIERRERDQRSAEAIGKLRDMSHLIDSMVSTVRLITTELRPGLLDDFGLAAAIEWQLQEFEVRTGIATELDGADPDPPLSIERATGLFRIVQEALSNVAWHAQAQHVAVRLAHSPGELCLSVHDDGLGIGPEPLANPKSLGLLGMRERARLLGGEMDISGAPGAGTTLLVRIPL